MGRVLGIDLGTTYSAVAYVDEHGEAKIINDAVDTNQRIIPSVVYFNTENNIIVGQDAKDETSSPEKVIAFVKREMGKNKDEVRKDENTNKPTPYDFYGKRYSPEEISAFILKKLKENAENFFQGEEINDVIITVPAYFNNLEREATKTAGKIAGFNVLQVINEPTAAAIAYRKTGLGQKAQKVFVFDLGGGTFDVTILDIDNNGVIDTITSDGDHKLGGKDWDDRIIKFVVDKFIDKYSEDPRNDSEVMGELRIKAENAKKKLSLQNEQKITINYNGNKLRVDITKDKFEELTADLMANVKDLCEIVLNHAKLKWNDIDTILLVGGSSRMPMVQNLLKEISGKEIRTDLIQPDECVAMGAALLASAPQDIQDINDSVTHTYGIIVKENGERIVDHLIKKDTKYPYEHEEIYHTEAPYQETLHFSITQGESQNPENVTIIKEGTLVIDPNPQIIPVKVKFRIDKSDTLIVTGVANGKEITMKVESSTMSNEDIIKSSEQMNRKTIS